MQIVDDDTSGSLSNSTVAAWEGTGPKNRTYTESGDAASYI